MAWPCDFFLVELLTCPCRSWPVALHSGERRKKRSFEHAKEREKKKKKTGLDYRHYHMGGSLTAVKSLLLRHVSYGVQQDIALYAIGGSHYLFMVNLV